MGPFDRQRRTTWLIFSACRGFPWVSSSCRTNVWLDRNSIERSNEVAPLAPFPYGYDRPFVKIGIVKATMCIEICHYARVLLSCPERILFQLLPERP